LFEALQRNVFIDILQSFWFHYAPLVEGKVERKMVCIASGHLCMDVKEFQQPPIGVKFLQLCFNLHGEEPEFEEDSGSESSVSSEVEEGEKVESADILDADPFPQLDSSLVLEKLSKIISLDPNI
jgi:hypothetical protein